MKQVLHFCMLRDTRCTDAELNDRPDDQLFIILYF